MQQPSPTVPPPVVHCRLGKGREGAVQQHLPCSAAFVASPDLQPQTLTWVVAPDCAAADVYFLGSPSSAAFADLSLGGAAAAAGEHAGAAVGLHLKTIT